MNKLAKILAVALCGAMLLTGCGTSDSNETKSASAKETEATEETAATRGNYEASAYCKLDDYKNITIKKSDIEASKDDIQSNIDSLISNSKELKEQKADYKAEDGDTVNIDYTGYIDGKAFEKGSDTKYDLTLGSNSFIDGFEKGLIGVKKGDKKDLNLTFPEDYSDKDKAGKDVVFKVTVNSVKKEITPEYNDKLVASKTEYKTTAEYEKALKQSIEDNNRDTKLIEALMAKAKFENGYPESLEKYYKNRYTDYYNSMMQSMYGVTLEGFAKQMNKDVESVMKDYGINDQIENAVKTDLIFGVIAEKENLTPTDEEYKEYIEKAVKEAGNGMTKEEMEKKWGKDELNLTFTLENAYKYECENIVIK